MRKQNYKVTIEPGMSLASVRDQLGPADGTRPAKNERSEEMGAMIHTYVRSRNSIEFILQTGQSRLGAILELVSDAKGKIIRLVQNPNPRDSMGKAVQRGLPGYVIQARVPRDFPTKMS